MKLELGNAFLDRSELTELGIWKSVGEHSQLITIVRFAEADAPADLGALLGQPLVCRFRDGDLQADLFKGIILAVDLVNSESEGQSRMARVVALSESIKADLVPRYRVFQDRAATLRDITDQVLASGIAGGERKRGDFSRPVPLSVQYGETDFQYLKRLLGAWGIPIVVDDVHGKFYAGSPESMLHAIPEADVIGDGYGSRIAPLLRGESYAIWGGRLGELQKAIARFADGLGERSQYFPSSVHEASQKRQEEELSAFDLADFSLRAAQYRLRTKRVFVSVGNTVQVAQGPAYTVALSVFWFSLGQDRRQSVDQEYTLVRSSELYPIHLRVANRVVVPFNTHHRTYVSDLQPLGWCNRGESPIAFPLAGYAPSEVPWHSRVFMAEVTKNDGDPEHLARVQVRFDWEVDGSDESKQCWVDVLTPFAGHAEQSYGFLMLPEVGEKVLVRFIEPWDDKPVIIGSLRREGVIDALNPTKYKVIRTPGGNCIDFISDAGTETIRLRAGPADGFHIVVESSGGKTQIKMESNGLVKIKGHEVRIEGDIISLESQSSMGLESGGGLSLKSTTGAVTIKGPLIELN